MPKVLRFAGLLLAAGLACGTAAAGEKKRNTLTPKEIAEGWLMLFDGETTFGWTAKEWTAKKVNEKYWDFTANDGTLALTTKKGGVIIDCNTRFRAFELSGEYRLFDSLRARLTVEKTFGVGKTLDQPGFGVVSGGDFRPTTEWRPFSARVGSETWKIVVDGKTVSELPVPKKREPNIERPTPLSSRISFFVSENGGGRLELRNVKLRPLGLASLFNGKDLSGWKVFQDPKRSKSKFEVTPAGELLVTNGSGDLQTEGKFADFVLQLECKTNGKHLNSGVFFRCVPDQYQNGYEAQIHNGYKGDDRTRPTDFGTGAIYRRVPARKVVANDNEWFTMTVVANGPHIATWVNGYQTVDWTDTRKPADNPRQGLRTAAGHISIQGHDPTTDILFRNIRLAELKRD